MTTKPYRHWAPHQPFLLPPSPSDWLPKNHLVYFLLDVVAELDLSAIESVIQARDPRGVQPYPPQMMVALLLYGYSRGVYSSRRIARAVHEDVAMRVIAAGHHPHFTTIASFRQEHLEALGALFLQALKMCAASGLAKLGHVSLDGTKIQANASKHSAMSYDRMQVEEKRLADEIAALLKLAAAKDEEEDEHLGEGEDEIDVPAELARREDRLGIIRAAREALKQEAALARAAELRALADDNDQRAEDEKESSAAKAAATRAANQRKKADELDPPGDDPDDGPPGDGGAGPTVPLHAPAHDADGEPHPKAQRNFTDPDSRIMKKGTDCVQAYNAQAAVDAESHVIVSHALSNQAPDAEYFQPVMQGVADNLGRLPEKGSADAGYWSAENAAWAEEQGIDAYIAVRRERHSEQGPNLLAPAAEAEAALAPTSEPPGSPAGTAAESEAVIAVASEVEAGEEQKNLVRCSAPPPSNPKDRMRAKLASREGREVYRLRKSTPEPVFGNIKEARGFRRFLLRGLHNVRHEWALICTVHNLLKLYGARMAM